MAEIKLIGEYSQTDRPPAQLRGLVDQCCFAQIIARPDGVRVQYRHTEETNTPGGGHFEGSEDTWRVTGLDFKAVIWRSGRTWTVSTATEDKAMAWLATL